MRHINTFVRSFLTTHQVTITSIYPRIIGVLIIFKMIIPLIILLVLVVGGWQAYSEVSKEVERVNSVLQPKVALAKSEIAKVRGNIQNLSGELARIKSEVDNAGKKIDHAITPINKGFESIANAIDGIRESLLKLIPGKDAREEFKRLVPKINIGDIELPNININPNLGIDMKALASLKVLSKEVLSEAETSLDTAIRIWSVWVCTVKTIFYLLLFWFVLLFVGIASRAGEKLTLGLRLIEGVEKKASLQML